MNIDITEQSRGNFSYRIDIDLQTVLKINELIKFIIENPFREIGNPESLKHGLKNFWSKKITYEHRLVYKVSGEKGIDQNAV